MPRVARTGSAPSPTVAGSVAADRAGTGEAMAAVTRLIRAAPDDVWDVLADPETYPRWLVGAVDIRAVDGDFPAPGADFHHEVGAGGPATLPDRTTALESTPARSLSLLVRARPLFEGVVRFRLEAAPEGTSVRMDETPTGFLRPLAPVLAPLLVARNAWSLARLRDLLERRGGGSRCVSAGREPRGRARR